MSHTLSTDRLDWFELKGLIAKAVGSQGDKALVVNVECGLDGHIQAELMVENSRGKVYYKGTSIAEAINAYNEVETREIREEKVHQPIEGTLSHLV